MPTQRQLPDAVTPAALAATFLLAACGGSSGGSMSRTTTPTPTAELAESKILIEHNATDEDTGFQGFADGEPWNGLRIDDSAGNRILTVTAAGGLFGFGLTELFFETNEPENAEVPIADVLARLPEGSYAMRSDEAAGGALAGGDALFTHLIAQGPELLTPADGATGLDAAAISVSWEAVGNDLDGNALTIDGYQVIVAEQVEPEFPDSFMQNEISLHVRAGVTSVSIPAEFMRTDACYEYEVLAIEASGNQTLASAEFQTGAGCVEVEEPDEPPLKDAKLLIEYNSTDDDTGFQGFADGDPWDLLTIAGPGSVEILRATAGGGLAGFGLTEFFFETFEPEQGELSQASVLALLPEGSYSFQSSISEGGSGMRTATLTHDIAAPATLLNPVADAEVDPGTLVVSWLPVSTDLAGDPITVAGYQVIVEEDTDALEFPNGFAQFVFSAWMPPSASSVSVPPEFMRDGTDYKAEIIVIEASGNQTITEVEFATP